MGMDYNEIVKIKGALSVAIGIIACALGGFDKYIQLLAFMVVFDFALGIMASVKKKSFSSTVARWGIVNKVLYFVCVALCYMLDGLLGTNMLLRNIAITWFLICEASSILENLVIIGLPMPDGLVGVLIQAKNGFSVRIIDIVKKIVTEAIGENGKDKKDESEVE